MVKTNHALSNSALGNCNTEVKTAISIFLWHCKIYTLTTFEKMKKKIVDFLSDQITYIKHILRLFTVHVLIKKKLPHFLYISI